MEKIENSALPTAVKMVRVWLFKLLDQERYHPSWFGRFVNPNYLVRKRIANFVQQHTGKMAGDIMDFGGGENPYKRFLDCASYVSVDFAPSLNGAVVGNDHAKRRSGVDHVYYDGQHLPFNNETFDGILATEVLEHVFNAEQIIGELFRVLRPGGRMVVTVPFVMYEHEAPYDFARYTPYGISYLVKQVGFRIISLERLTTFSEAARQFWIWKEYTTFRQARGLQHILSPCRVMVIAALNATFNSRLVPSSSRDLCCTTIGLVVVKPYNDATPNDIPHTS